MLYRPKTILQSFWKINFRSCLFSTSPVNSYPWKNRYPLSVSFAVRSGVNGLLNALQMDYYAIPFPAVTFDAIWSLNTLLHVPLRSLGSVLDELRRVLLDRGLFFLGCYGGSGQEGTFDKDHYEPKRFFSFKTDDDLTRIAADHFDIVDFHTVDIGMNYHFQSLTLRK